jgi:hypothetical protein
MRTRVFGGGLFRTRSAAVYGIGAHPIDVEVDVYSSGTARPGRGSYTRVGWIGTSIVTDRPNLPRAQKAVTTLGP